MSQITLNPYPDLGTEFIAGMNAIISVPITSIDILVTQVVNYVEATYYTAAITPAQKIELKSVAYSAIDSYVNGSTNIALYNSKQRPFINMLTGPSLTSFLTIDTIGNRILDVEDNITEANLRVDEQTPLFFGTMIGNTTYNYWLAQIPVAGPWTPYFTTAKVSAMGNVPFWTAAAIEGALIGAKSTFKSMIDDTTQVVGNEIISALIGGLTIAAGKVIFLWIPRINSSYINSFNNLYDNHFKDEIIGGPVKKCVTIGVNLGIFSFGVLVCCWIDTYPLPPGYVVYGCTVGNPTALLEGNVGNTGTILLNISNWNELQMAFSQKGITPENNTGIVENDVELPFITNSGGKIYALKGTGRIVGKNIEVNFQIR
jgi:hypothetical protein